MDFDERIDTLRRTRRALAALRGFPTHTALARATGHHVTTVARWFDGQETSLSVLRSLASALRVTIGEADEPSSEVLAEAAR